MELLNTIGDCSALIADLCGDRDRERETGKGRGSGKRQMKIAIVVVSRAAATLAQIKVAIRQTAD